MAFIELIPTGILQGLILAIIALGIMIPFRILNFPDLTAEGSYPLGGAACASMLLNGLDPVTATILACLAAGLLGMGTAIVHIRLHINTLLAGIILSTMVYSVNLRLMAQPNLALFNNVTLFSFIGENLLLKTIFIFIIILLLVIPLFLFLLTEKGLRFRAVGLNPNFAERQSISLTQYTLLGLFIGNALCGLAGSLMVQLQNYADIGMGVGIIIHALAALMIGESIIGNNTLLSQISAPIIGALIYQQIQGLALTFGLAPSDLKLLTGIIVLGVIGLHRNKSCNSPSI